MISIAERKIALLIQANLIRRELDNLKRQDHREAELNTYKGRTAYTGLMALVDSLESQGK